MMPLRQGSPVTSCPPISLHSRELHLRVRRVRVRARRVRASIRMRVRRVRTSMRVRVRRVRTSMRVLWAAYRPAPAPRPFPPPRRKAIARLRWGTEEEFGVNSHVLSILSQMARSDRVRHLRFPRRKF